MTDPKIIRYFMTIPEAAQLVIQAGAMGQGGDVFVLDMMMPGMTGRQTLEKLRENPDFANVPAIFMTARAQPNELEELRGIGATEVISKPFDPMSLADQIKAAIA